MRRRRRQHGRNSRHNKFAHAIAAGVAASVVLGGTPVPADAIIHSRALHHGSRIGRDHAGAGFPDVGYLDHRFAGHQLVARPFYGDHFGYGMGNPGPGWGLRGPQ